MQDRLNHLMVTYVHKEELDKLDLRDVGNANLQTMLT